MWEIIGNRGLPDLFIDILKDLYSGSTSCLSTQDILSLSFPMKTGVHQGCILSPPLLFNLVLDWIFARAVEVQADGVVVGDGFIVVDLL